MSGAVTSGGVLAPAIVAEFARLERKGPPPPLPSPPQLQLSVHDGGLPSVTEIGAAIRSTAASTSMTPSAGSLASMPSAEEVRSTATSTSEGVDLPSMEEIGAILHSHSGGKLQLGSAEDVSHSREGDALQFGGGGVGAAPQIQLGDAAAALTAAECEPYVQSVWREATSQLKLGTAAPAPVPQLQLGAPSGVYALLLSHPITVLAGAAGYAITQEPTSSCEQQQQPTSTCELGALRACVRSLVLGARIHAEAFVGSSSSCSGGAFGAAAAGGGAAPASGGGAVDTAAPAYREVSGTVRG